MAVLSVTPLLFALLAAPSAADDLQEVLAKLAAYSASYHHSFRQFVATEERAQKHWDRHRKLQQRITVSDYYVVSLPSAPRATVELRETLSVDGKPIRNDRGRILNLLTHGTGERVREAERISRENRRYDLGMFQRFEEYTNMGLLYVDGRVQRNVEYLLRPPAYDGTEVLEFRESGLRTVAMVDDRPAPATGLIYFTWPDAKVQKVDLTIHDVRPDGDPLVRCVVEYEPGPDGLMLPSRARHFMPGIVEGQAPNSWESDARYTNYRRFTAEVKLTSEGPVQ